RFFFQAEDGIRDRNVTGVQTCALPISPSNVTPEPRGRGEADDGVRVGVTTCYFGGFSHSQVLPEDALTSRDTTFGSTCGCAARAPHSGALPDCATSRDLDPGSPHPVNSHQVQDAQTHSGYQPSGGRTNNSGEPEHTPA